MTNKKVDRSLGYLTTRAWVDAWNKETITEVPQSGFGHTASGV